MKQAIFLKKVFKSASVVVSLLSTLFFLAGCDTELGHSHGGHDGAVEGYDLVHDDIYDAAHDNAYEETHDNAYEGTHGNDLNRSHDHDGEGFPTT